MSVPNSPDQAAPFAEPPRCPKCHAPMTLTDVTLGAMDRYTRTFECCLCDYNVTVRAPDVTELEAELTAARARVAGLEAELPTLLKGVGEAVAHASTLREWNSEIETAGGEGALIPHMAATTKQRVKKAVLVWDHTLQAKVANGTYIINRCEDGEKYEVLYRMTGDATSRTVSKKVATVKKAEAIAERVAMSQVQSASHLTLPSATSQQLCLRCGSVMEVQSIAPPRLGVEFCTLRCPTCGTIREFQFHADANGMVVS